MPSATRVCSKHFHGGQPSYEMLESHPDWAPSLHLGHNEVKNTDTGRIDRKRKRDIVLRQENFAEDISNVVTEPLCTDGNNKCVQTDLTSEGINCMERDLHKIRKEKQAFEQQLIKRDILSREAYENDTEKTSQDDNASQPGDNNSYAWHNAPFFNKPVIGCGNRTTQSIHSLNFPLDQSAYHGYASQWGNSAMEDVSIVGSPETKNRNIGTCEETNDLYSHQLQGWPIAEQQEKDSKSPSNQVHHNYNGFLREGDKPAEDLSYGQPGLYKTEEDVRELQTETYTIRYAHEPCGRYSRLITSLLVLMGLAIVGLAIALTMSILRKTDAVEHQDIHKGYPVVKALMTLKILNKNFTTAMADIESPEFSSIAIPYSIELDQLFLKSPLADVYHGNRVLSLGPGSIKTNATLLFMDTGVVTNNADVQNVISSAERASQWEQSDAREIGQFVVCADCATVDLQYTRVEHLPPSPIVQEGVTSSAASTSDRGLFGNGSITMPSVLLRNATPFLSDGHFVISCDVNQAGDWSNLTLGFKPDNSSAEEPDVVLVTLPRNSMDVAIIAENERSRIKAFPSSSSSSVTLVVNVTSVTCADRGDYWCRLRLSNGQQFSGNGRVGLLELPTAPIIQETWNSTVWDVTPVYACSAKLGYPPGKLTFSVLNSASHLLSTSIRMANASDCETETLLHLQAQELSNTASSLLCQVFSEHLEQLDLTKYSASHRVVLLQKLEIQTKSASINDGLAALRCRLLNLPKWSRLTLLKIAANGERQEMLSLLSNNAVEWKDNRLKHRALVTKNVSASMAQLSIFIFSLKCLDEALYTCSVVAEVNITEPQAYLNVFAKPTRPTLAVPVDVAENDVTHFPITCKAKVGRPAGDLILSVRGPQDLTFHQLIFNQQNIIPLSCNTEVRGTYYPSAGEIGNGSTISCHVAVNESLQNMVAATADAQVFQVLPENMCAGLQDTNVSHPTDCRHIIHCKNDVIASVSKCPDLFCFSTASGTCSEPISPLPLGPELPESVCYPDKDGEKSADPNNCGAYISCHKGRETTRYCSTGQLYVGGEQCSSDVTQTHCYKNLDTSRWILTNSTQLVN